MAIPHNVAVGTSPHAEICIVVIESHPFVARDKNAKLIFLILFSENPSFHTILVTATICTTLISTTQLFQCVCVPSQVLEHLSLRHSGNVPMH